MFKKFGLVISTLVGLLTAIGSGMPTSAQPADLSVRFSEPNLQDKTSISSISDENSLTSLEERTRRPNLQDKTSISSISDENSLTSLEERTDRPQKQETSEPCPACGMG